MILPSSVRTTASDLQYFTPGLVGGRSGGYGTESPHLRVGASYWRGTLSVWMTTRAKDEERGLMEAVSNRFVFGSTLQVPVGRPALIEFVNASDAVFEPASGVNMTSVAGGMFALTGASKITVKPGFLFTVGDKLYQYMGLTAIDAAAVPVQPCTPAYPTTGSAQTVEFRAPWAIGQRRTENLGITLPFRGVTGGPWSFVWDEKA